MNLKYRADIDGLRAVAVLAVIFFHAGVPGFSGGFVGVDIFFVISGFLITSIILKEVNADEFSITRFYERRIRRIFPALFPVLIFTLLVGFFVLDYKTFKELGQSVVSTTFFSSNILFWQKSGYFDTLSSQKPLLHTWSLGVEEQFYIFFPLLLIAIRRFLKQKYFLWLNVLVVVSFLGSIWQLQNQPSAAFYLVFARTWELMLGSIIAVGVIPSLHSKPLCNAVSLFGFGLIVYSIAFFTKFTPFPGPNALVPVLGSAIIIYTGVSGASIMNKILGLKPLVFVGLISYSLYLWHWPLIVFIKYLLFRELNPLEVSGLLLATFVVSFLSMKYIERPFRGSNSLIPEKKRLFIVAAATMVVFSLFGLVIHLQNGMPARTEANRAILENDHEEEWKKGIEIEQQTETNIADGKNIPVIGAAHRAPVFLLWGDSHGRVLSTSVDEKAKSYGLAGYLTTCSGSPPLLSYSKKVAQFNGEKFNEKVMVFIKSHPEIKTVILASMWSGYSSDGSMAEDDFLTWKPKESNGAANESKSVLLQKGILNTVNQLIALHRNVVLVSDVPEIGGDPLRLYCVQHLTGESYTSLLPTVSEYRKSNQAVEGLFRELGQRQNITVVSPERLLFDKAGRAMLVHNNRLLYRDVNHLTLYGAHYVAPAFDELFSKMVGSK
jgi:peptidoglycan/LPS O-acetylase OafA/YrhL